MITITAATMMKGFHKNSFSGIQHVMTFCGIGLYWLFHLKNLDYPFISHYTREDENLYLRAMYIFYGNRLESNSRLVHTFMEMISQGRIAKQFSIICKKQSCRLADKTKLQILLYA